MADLLPLGVHIGLRHRDHIADSGLGYTAIKDIFLSPIEWWDASEHNSFREPPEEKDAFDRGEALHVHTLDGPKVYKRVYGIAPTKKTHPDYLDLVDSLQRACAAHGLSNHGLKSDLIARLVRAKAPVKILEHERSLFRRSGKKEIGERDDARIKILYAMMMRSRDELKISDRESLTLKQALTGALTEVSVFWEDGEGIRQRARFDILKPNFSGDLKSITHWKKSNFDKALLSEIIHRGYMIQCAHYHEGRHELRRAVAEGRVFGGNKTQRKRLDRIAEADLWAWLFVFGKMDGAAQVKGIIIRPETSGQFAKAKTQREEALAMYLYHRELHGGLDRPWFDPNVVFEPEETAWPQFSVLGQA